MYVLSELRRKKCSPAKLKRLIADLVDQKIPTAMRKMVKKGDVELTLSKSDESLSSMLDMLVARLWMLCNGNGNNEVI